MILLTIRKTFFFSKVYEHPSTKQSVHPSIDKALVFTLMGKNFSRLKMWQNYLR